MQRNDRKLKQNMKSPTEKLKSIDITEKNMVFSLRLLNLFIDSFIDFPDINYY